MDDIFESTSLDDLFDLAAGEKDDQPPKKPFKFLDYYEIEDRDIFCGRDIEIAEIYTRFFRSRILLLYGESGAGKTSLIRCGLQAEIPREDMHFLFLRSVNDPLDTLRKEVLRYLSSPEDEEPEAVADLLRETVFRKGKPLALVFDQFEEFFIFQPPEVRERFAREVASWLESDIDIRIICCIREDYLARVTELESRLPQLYENKLWVRRMSKDQAEIAIIEPCRKCGVAVDRELADELLTSLGRDSKGVELPILQVLLDTLYNNAVAKSADAPALTLADYRSMGEIESILARFVEAKVDNRDQPDQVRQVLKSMITPEGTRRVSSLADITKNTSQFGMPLPESRVKSILDQLIDDRVVREDADNCVYELRHDTLARTIHKWLSGIEKELMDVHQLIQNRYNEYQTRGSLLDQSAIDYIKPYLKRLRLNIDLVGFVEKSINETQKSRRRWQKLVIATTSVLFVVISSLGLLSYFNLLKAQHTLGIVFAEKAEKSFFEKDYNKANIYSLYALSMIGEGEDGNERARAAGIILSSGEYPVISSYSGDTYADASLRHIIYSTDGRKLAAGIADYKIIRVWELESERLLATLDASPVTSDRLYSVCLSPDGRTVAAGSLDNNNIYIWDVGTEELTAVLNDPTRQKNRMTTLSFSRDGRLLAAGSWDHPDLLFWDIAQKKVARALTSDDRTITGYYNICLSEDGKTLAANVRRSNIVQLWDVESREVISTLDGGENAAGQITAVSLSSDGKFLATGSSNNSIRIWDITSREGVLAFEWHASRIASICFSPDGCNLAVGSRDNAIKLWDVSAECVKRPIDADFRDSYNIAISRLFPGGKVLATAKKDGTILLWDLPEKNLVSRLVPESGPVGDAGIYDLEFSDDERVLAVVSRGTNTVSLWDLTSGTQIGTIDDQNGIEGTIYKTCLTPNGDLLAMMFRNSDLVRLWDVREHKPVRDLRHEEFRRTYSFSFSPDGGRLAVGSRYDETVRLWDVATGDYTEFVKAPAENNNDPGVPAVGFSPDGRLLAAGMRGNSDVILWDIASREMSILNNSNAYGASVTNIDFSRDGAKLVASSRGVDSIGIWDLDNARLDVVLKAKAVGVHSAMLSNDSRQMIAVTRNNDVLIWNLTRLADLDSVKTALKTALEKYKFRKNELDLIPQI